MAAVSPGAWLSTWVLPRIPLRRSTLLLMLLFVALIVLYLAIRTDEHDLSPVIFVPTSELLDAAPSSP